MTRSFSSKQDREKVAHWVNMAPERIADPQNFLTRARENLRRNVSGLDQRPPGRWYLVNSFDDVLVADLRRIAGDILHRSIALRVLNDDPAELVSGLFLSGRVWYVGDLYKPATWTTYDCLHVFEILDALAIDDDAVIAAYLERHPGPAKSGHPYTVLLCKAVTAILQDAPDLADLVPKLRSRKDGKFDEAMLRCLASIIENDAVGFTHALSEMLPLYRRKFLADGLRQYVPIHVHGMYRLGCKAFPRLHDSAPPSMPDNPRWDGAFEDAVATVQFPSLAVLTHFSADLPRLAAELPPTPAEDAWRDLCAEP